MFGTIPFSFFSPHLLEERQNTEIVKRKTRLIYIRLLCSSVFSVLRDQTNKLKAAGKLPEYSPHTGIYFPHFRLWRAECIARSRCTFSSINKLLEEMHFKWKAAFKKRTPSTSADQEGQEGLFSMKENRPLCSRPVLCALCSFPYHFAVSIQRKGPDSRLFLECSEWEWADVNRIKCCGGNVCFFVFIQP